MVHGDNKTAIVESAMLRAERRRPELLHSNVLSEAESAPYLRAYWQVIQKRRWTIFSLVVVVFTLALIATLKEAPVYRAKAIVEIEKENPSILTVQDLFQLENVSDNYLESQYKILQTDSLA